MAGALLSARMVAAAPEAASDITALFNQGAAAYHDGDLAGAREKWDAGLKLAEAAGNDPLTALFAANLALVYGDMGDDGAGFEFFEKALHINEKQQNYKNAGANLNNMGVLYKKTGNFEKALECFSRSLEQRRKINDQRSAGKVLINMGALHLEMGDYRSAFGNLQDSIIIFRKMKDQLNEIVALLNLGQAFAGVGQYEKALATYDQAFEINQAILLEKNKANKTTAVIFEKIGSVHLKQKAFDNAIGFYQKALDLEQELGNQKRTGDLLCNLGVAHKQAGDFDAALECYEAALEIKRFFKDTVGEGAVLGNMGLLREQTGKLEKAREDLKAGYDLCMKSPLPEYRWRACRGLGKIEARLDHYDAAVPLYLAALDEIETLRAGLGQADDKISFMQDKLHVFDELIDLYADMDTKFPGKGHDRDAFEIFERKQGRMMLEGVGKSGARKFARIPDAVVDEEMRLTLELEIIRTTLAADIAGNAGNHHPDTLRNLKAAETRAVRALDTVREKIRQAYPAYYALKYPRPTEVSRLQRAVLHPDEIMLVYNVMDNQSLLWVVGPTDFSLHRLGASAQDFTRMVNAFRDQDINFFKGQKLRGAPVAAASGSGDSGLRGNLHAALFPAAIQKCMAGHDKVFIVPTGSLYLLPFEALQPEAGRYLIEDHSFAYLSSASLLAVLRAGGTSGDASADASGGTSGGTSGDASARYPFLGFAHPSYEFPEQSETLVDEMQVRSLYSIMRGTVEPLPETEQEIRQIIEILKAPRNSRPLYVQKEAARSVVLDLNARGALDDYQYISFACHGILPDQDSGVLQPSLLLCTPDPVTRDIGLLSMADVFELRLNADLVALAACNTGRGEIVGGEGVMGLSRAFMYAGAPAVSVNLWSVETISAQMLSVEFFKALHQGKTRAGALRESKLRLIRGTAGDQFQLPFFWAPMVLFGDGF